MSEGKITANTFVQEILPLDLKVGDEFWDKQGNYHYTVVGAPVTSINRNVFSSDNTCVVVTVEYNDGARGSRLFPTDIKIFVRRNPA